MDKFYLVGLRQSTVNTYRLSYAFASAHSSDTRVEAACKLNEPYIRLSQIANYHLLTLAQTSSNRLPHLPLQHRTKDSRAMPRMQILSQPTLNQSLSAYSTGAPSLLIRISLVPRKQLHRMLPSMTPKTSTMPNKAQGRRRHPVPLSHRLRGPARLKKPREPRHHSQLL